MSVRRYLLLSKQIRKVKNIVNNKKNKMTDPKGRITTYFHRYHQQYKDSNYLHKDHKVVIHTPNNISRLPMGNSPIPTKKS